MVKPTRRTILLSMAAGAIGAIGGSAGAAEFDRSVPVLYAETSSELPSPSGPAMGITQSGIYLQQPKTGWNGPIEISSTDTTGASTATPTPDPDQSSSPAVERSREIQPPDITAAGVEVFDPAEGSEKLQALLDEYGNDPLYLVVSNGELVFERSLLIPSNTWMRGYGMTTVVTLAEGTELNIAGLVRIGDGAANVRLSSFVIDGNRKNVAESGKEYGLFSKNAHNLHCERLWVRNCPGYGFDPHADELWETTSNLRIHGCVAENNGLDGITLAGIEHGLVTSCLTRDNDRHGLQVTDPDNRDISVSTTSALGNGGSGIVVQNGASEVTVTANLSRENGRDGIKISNTDDWSAHCTVTGNTVAANDRYGITVLKATDVAILGNTVRENAREAGNAEISLQASDGWGAQNCIIVGNTISSNGADYGIDEQSTAVGPNVIVANTTDNAAYTNINRRNPNSMTAFNIGQDYKVSGTVTIAVGKSAAVIDSSPHHGHQLSDVSVTPTTPLGGATQFWVAETEDGYRIKLDTEPEESVTFAYTIDAR